MERLSKITSTFFWDRCCVPSALFRKVVFLAFGNLFKMLAVKFFFEFSTMSVKREQFRFVFYSHWYAFCNPGLRF